MLPAASLAGRVVLVTGGGSGLGRAMALELSRLGAKVAVVGRRREPLDETVALLEGDGDRRPHRVSQACRPPKSKLKSTTWAPSRSSSSATSCFLSNGQYKNM